MKNGDGMMERGMHMRGAMAIPQHPLGLRSEFLALYIQEPVLMRARKTSKAS